MISFRGWMTLLVVYIAYLTIGGFSFQALESPQKCDRKLDSRQAKAIVLRNIDILNGNLSSDQREILRNILDGFVVGMADQMRSLNGRLGVCDAFKSRLFEGESKCQDHEDVRNWPPDDPCETWSFYNSFFFSFTALTTIGFGHLYPETDSGKLLCIFYSLLGVPINGLLIGNLGAFFGSKLKKFHARPEDNPTNECLRIFWLVIRVTLYIIPGFILFMALPSVLIKHIENWTYLDSIYFTFIAMLTIGFGDFVAGRDSDVLDMLGAWKIAYQGGLILWLIFGLGYVFMIITIITDGLKAPAKKVADKYAMAEKHFVARIIQEILLMRGTNKTVEKYESSNEGILNKSFQFNDDDDDDDDVKVLTKDIITPQNDTSFSPRVSPRVSFDRIASISEEVVDELNQNTVESLQTFVHSAAAVQRTLNEELLSTNGRRITPPIKILTTDVDVNTPSGALNYPSSLSSESVRPNTNVNFIIGSYGSFVDEQRPFPSKAQTGSSISVAVGSGKRLRVSPFLNPRIRSRLSLGVHRHNSFSGLPTNRGGGGTQRKLSSIFNRQSTGFIHDIVPERRRGADGDGRILPEILKGVTLEEFFQAIERVKQDGIHSPRSLGDIEVLSVVDSTQYPRDEEHES